MEQMFMTEESFLEFSQLLHRNYNVGSYNTHHLFSHNYIIPSADIL
jgi:hypothetical protein